MAGKHSVPTGVSGGKVVVAAAAVLLLGGAGYGGYQLVGGKSDDTAVSTPASPASATTTGSAASTPTGEPTASGRDASTPAATSGRTSASAATDALPAGCRDQLVAGRKAIAAADRSYRDWHGHTQADLDYRSGKNSWRKTSAIWADTKKRGDRDVAGFRTAHAAYRKTSGCQGVDRAQAGPTVTPCLDRFRAMRGAVSAGAKVNDDWAHHVQMMKRKDHTNPRVYAKEWRSMVDGSERNQSGYRTARAAYDKAPACAA